MLRGLVAAAAAAAVTGAVLMRSWDRAAGRRVAELTRARASDEWKTEERLADLESDIEESRELRARLDAKLRAKRVELAALRGEHAALLRRYATAETERASALEGRRLLAIEAAAPKALPAAGASPTPSAYLRASMALDHLSRNAAEQESRTSREARGRGVAEPEGKHQAAAGSDAVSSPEHARPSSAVVPYAAERRRASRVQGGFDFFGNQKSAAAAIAAVQNEDLADVVGEEALADAHRASGDRVVGQVIDLTAHDETEQLDVAVLRSAIS